MTPDDLRAYRQRLALSQAQLARHLDISVRTLQDWEIGRRNPPSFLGLALERVAQLIEAAAAP